MGEILKIGFPAMLSNAANSLVTFGMNRILLSFTSTATAVYGIYVRLQVFSLMPIYGLRNTIVSILAYNYGAKHKSRLRQAICICLITSILITVVLMGVFLFLPGVLLSLFDAQEGMLEIGTLALKVISIGIPMTGISTILGAAFQSFGDSSKELVISMTRMAVLLLSAWVLSGTGKLEIVWWAFVITETAALILAVIFWSRVNNNFIKPMADDNRHEENI